MSVCIRRLNCLSLAKEDEKYGSWKALPGDSIKVFFINGKNIVGKLEKIRNNDLLLTTNIGLLVLDLKDIKSFDVINRGILSNNYFR